MLLRVAVPNARLASLVVAIGVLVFVLNRNPLAEQNVFLQQHIPYADYLRGEGSRTVTTYPMWGYPALVALLGDVPRVALQFALAAAVATITLRIAKRNTPHGIWWHVIAAGVLVPWFALGSLNSASAVAVPLVWLSVFAFVRAEREKRSLWSFAGAGALLGLAVNFRSEFVPLALVVPAAGLVWTFATSRGLPRRRFPGPMTFAALALLPLAPWAALSYETTGTARLSSSNAGAVSVISLGQLPGNPWGIIHDDSEALRLLGEAGYEELAPYSEDGDRRLREMFVELITDDPLAYASKVMHNARNVFAGGLYFGDWDAWFPGIGTERVDVVKEKLKSRFGLNPNARQIEAYKAAGLWDDSPTPSEMGLLAVATFYVLGTDVLFLVAVAAALYLAFSRRLASWEAVATGLLLYVVALATLLQYQPRHMNAAWPALAILFFTGLPTIRRLLLTALPGHRSLRAAVDARKASVRCQAESRGATDP